MNCLKARRKYDEEKANEEFERKHQEEREAYEKMTPEEKAEYDRKKKEQHEKIMELLGFTQAVKDLTHGDY